MSGSLVLGAALVAAAAPTAWLAVSGRRRVSPATLQRGFAPIDVRGAVLRQGARERALEPLVAQLAARVRRVTPAGIADRLQQKLIHAGLAGHYSVDQVLAAKLLLTVIVTAFGGLVVLGSGFAPLAVVVFGVALFVAWFGLDGLLDGRVAERRKTVQRELPDTMDQITISVEAGLAFEAAMARVAAESDTVLATELARTLQDIQLGVPRGEALESLAGRVDVAELRHFVTALRQAERYGIPLANVLRIQAGELREKRRQAAEEHAMKIPVKVLFPLIFCIFPTLFIVLLGPAAIRMTQNL